MSEDMEKRPTEAEMQDEGDEDVEAHKRMADDKSIGATEEGPDVEGHKLVPKKNPY